MVVAEVAVAVEVVTVAEVQFSVSYVTSMATMPSYAGIGSINSLPLTCKISLPQTPTTNRATIHHPGKISPNSPKPQPLLRQC